MLTTYSAVYCEAHVLNHHAGVDLCNENTLELLSCLCNLLFGERPQCDRTEQTDLDALCTCKLDSLFCNTRCRTERNDHVFCVVHELGLVANLVLANLAVFLLKLQVALLHNLRLKLERCDNNGLTALATS